MLQMTEYIIVQAGGRGSRLKHLTDNKPKALVPINNLPMIFHLFKKFPDSRFVIIADYKADVLEKYLASFSHVKYRIVNASGSTGTCAGISKALQFIPEKQPFMLIWSDLILGGNFKVPTEIGNYIGLSGSFRCRWKFEKGKLLEEPSKEYGVAGLFFFQEKSMLSTVAPNGEFVKWLSKQSHEYKGFLLNDVKEFGELAVIENLGEEKCRPFNNIKELNGHIVKSAVDAQGERLAVMEKTWYSAVMDKGYARIPKIYSFQPFEMEKIAGKNVYEYGSLSYDEKENILGKIISMLQELHAVESVPADLFSVWETYISKTYERLDKVRDMIPFANQERILINGRKCRNIFFYKDALDNMVNAYVPQEFCLIHGDCTFSNIMLKNDTDPVLIDPRGYFGYTELYGDTAYDWAKLYYSIKGNYDQFNRKRFSLVIKEDQIYLDIHSNGWEDMEPLYWSFLDGRVNPTYIKLFHAIIWLSLTTYAWEDYDSICGAFYNGLYYLEEILQ